MKGVPGIAINQDSLRKAASETPPRYLFEEVRQSKWALVVVSPEMLTTPGFNKVLTDSSFQQHLALVFIDECHLVDEQGTDFRQSYKSIGLLRSRIPTRIPWIAVSATLPPGPRFDAVRDSLGFHPDHYTYCTLQVDNPHICYIPRILQHPISGSSFLDLAWLIPTTVTSAHDITKTLIFCETIELGSRVYDFLCSLLPQQLCKDNKVILQYHSLLSQSGRTTVMENFRLGTTRIVIGTDCFTWGVDVPDIRNVVVFGLPSSFSKLVQQIGRAGRDGNQAYAITYAAQWVEDFSCTPPKLSKQDATNLKRREEMCQVLRHWFNNSLESCPRSVFCNHFKEEPSHPDNCCLHHYKSLPTLDPQESIIQQFSAPRTRAKQVRSDGTYKTFKEQDLVSLQQSASHMIAGWARQAWEETRGENTLFPSTSFFPDTLQRRLCDKIHTITSIDNLCTILKDWRHLDSYKNRLFSLCKEIVKGLDSIRKDGQKKEQETQKASPTIKIPPVKRDGGELVDERQPKRPCMR